MIRRRDTRPASCKANKNWTVPVGQDGKPFSNDGVMIAILQDIRQELRDLNAFLSRWRFVAVDHDKET